MILVRWVIVTLIVSVICSGLVGAARAVGQTHTPTPAFLETGACEQPCWHGLRPGVDYIDHFLRAVSDTSPYSGHTTDYGDGIARMFELSTFGAITLGDLIRAFGSPEHVGCFGADHSSLFAGQPIVMATRVYFADGLIEADVVRPEMRPQLTPDMRVRSIRYYAPGEPSYTIGEFAPWRGFASTRRHYLDCNPYP